MVMKRGSNWKIHYFFTCMQHDMPQSLLIFSIFFTPETPILGRSVESRSPIEEFFIFFLIFAF